MDVVKRNEVGIVSIGDKHEDKTVKRLPPKNLSRATGYLTLKARLLFNKLSKAFAKALILWYFDVKCHI